MNDLNEIRQFIAARGFKRIQNFSRDKRNLCYEKSNFESGYSIFLFLEFKPMAKAYSVHVGIESERAHACLTEISEFVNRFLDPLMRESNFLLRPCWCFFDAGRALKWRSVFVVPDPFARDGWHLLMKQLFNEFIDPLFMSVKHESALIELLSRNDTPFEWAYSPTVLRASELIALYTLLGMSVVDIRNKINPFEHFITKQISENSSISVFVETLVTQIQQSKNFKARDNSSPA